MPDRRKHRGPHPQDAELFRPATLPVLRQASSDYAWLLSRGYGPDASLTLVGDHFQLTARQRLALMRSTCSEAALTVRLAREATLADLAGQTVGIDGYNLLITLESALSGGLILIGHDGAYRDLASVHGTYRKVEETRQALELIIACLVSAHVGHVDFYLDRPVSNSGRLKTQIAELLALRGSMAPTWNIELVDSPDAVLRAHDGIVVTSDGGILDHCTRWMNLAAEIVSSNVQDAWRIDLSQARDT